jgi:hypothetical protein
LTVSQAVKGGFAFIAACKARSTAERIEGPKDDYLVRKQTFRPPTKVLAGKIDPKLRALDVTYRIARSKLPGRIERAVGVNERVIWIVKQDAKGVLGGVKALAGTPENRAAVLEAVKNVQRAKVLAKQFAKGFLMDLRGPNGQAYLHLRLVTGRVLPGVMQVPRGVLAVLIDRKQADRLIDHVVESKLLEGGDWDSPYRRKLFKPLPPGPAYVLTLSGGGWVYRKSLGWDLKMLHRLDALRKVLDGEAAKAMDKLLKGLEPQREKWEKEAVATKPAHAAKTVRFKTAKDAVAFITECVEKKNSRRLTAACAGDGQKAGRYLDALVRLHAATPLPQLYAGKTFPKERGAFTLGGHGRKWRHIHIKFVRKEDGWALADISVCR